MLRQDKTGKYLGVATLDLTSLGIKDADTVEILVLARFIVLEGGKLKKNVWWLFWGCEDVLEIPERSFKLFKNY